MEVRVCANQSGEFFTSNSTVFRERAEMGQSSRWWHQHAVCSSPPLGAPLPDPSRWLRHSLGPPSMGEAAGASQGTPQPTAHQHWPRSQILSPGHGAWRRGGRRVLCMWRRGQEGRGRQTASFVSHVSYCPPGPAPGACPQPAPVSGAGMWPVRPAGPSPGRSAVLSSAPFSVSPRPLAGRP